jgi:hypothetical protein
MLYEKCYLPSSNYCTVQQSTRNSNCTDSTLVRGRTARPSSSTVMKVGHWYHARTRYQTKDRQTDYRKYNAKTKASGIRVKTMRCDNAKEQMVPLNSICWSNGVMVEYVAPYTPPQNGKVERQFPTDLKRANAMLHTVKLSVAHKMKLQKEAIQYESTMANISIKDVKSPYEKLFGVPSPITSKTCVNFGRIGYVTFGNILKNKYKPRAFKCHMVGYATNHSAHTYKVFKYEPGKPG